MSKVLVIYGPTATGKTDLAIKLAKKYKGQLISADSRQVYKSLDIGTGKVSFASSIKKHDKYWIVDGIKIHGFDLVELPGYEPVSRNAVPGYETGSKLEIFSAANFLQYGKNSMIRIIELNKLPILVGGTGFYIKTLITGLESIGIPPNPKLRKKLEKLSIEQLYKKLEEVNHKKAKSMNQSDRANPRRLIRAIEIATDNQKLKTRSEKPASESHQPTIPPSTYLIIGLTAPNNYLYQRADKWLDQRLKNGLIEEVKNLIKQGTDTKWLENLGLEYRWITRYLCRKVEKEAAIERLKGDIHDFIRRQKTYFNQFKEQSIHIFDISQDNWQDKLEKTIESWYTSVDGSG